MAELRTHGCPQNILRAMQASGGINQTRLDCWAFANRVPVDFGAPPRPELFQNIARVVNPQFFEWHKWTHRMVEALCSEKFVGIAGCAGSAKTRNAMGFACTWWLADPLKSSVTYASTTSKRMRQRGWAEIQKYFYGMGDNRIGNFVDSRMLWQATKGDDKHSICGIAIEEGNVLESADKIQGVHTERQMLILDEAPSVPPGILEAIKNMCRYPKEFILLMLGNPRFRLDQFGRFIEPKDGWESVSIDDLEWITTPKSDWGGECGVCIRYDIEHSPNLDYPPDKPISRHLPTHAHVERLRRNAAYHNSPSYFTYERGYIPPDGLTKNLFSETAFIQGNAYGRHEFTGNMFTVIGALDPARGGDKVSLRFGVIGEVAGGGWGLEVMPPIEIPIKADSTETIDWQIERQVRAECEHVKYRNMSGYNCPPENLGVDGTGGSAGTVDVLQQKWSPKVMRVIFSGSAPEEPVNLDDARMANAVYGNLRSFMYHRLRDVMNSGQLRGLDKETAVDLTRIKINDDNKARIYLQDKKVFKKDYGHSPDDADALVVLVEVARRRGFKLAAVGQTKVAVADVSRELALSQAVYEDEPFSEPDPDDYAPAYQSIGG